MAMSDASILPKLLERHQELPFSGHHDNTATWRKFFVEDIFKNTNSSLVFWVIDALDECENPSSLFALLAQLPSHIRVFITSRPILEVEQNLRQLHHLVQQHQITEQDTLDDMAMLIGSRMDCMLAVDTDGREILKSKLLEKACGSFLWLSLVIKKLGTVYSKEAAEEVIDETPSEMTKLYAQMLESTVNDPGKAVLARSMIMWMLLASRPLTVEEMQNAIWLDINHTVPNLGASASAICGQLVCVNRRNEVDTIHLTAREYLLHQTEYSTIAIDRPHFHGRIAHSCLKILCNNRFQNPPLKIMDTPPSNQIPESKLADYACCYFSHHLRESAAEDSIAWDLLFQFLVSNLLLWIEHLAKNWKLHIMARTAGDMKEYLRRRIEYQTPHSSQKLALERWTTDIIRVGAKFGMYLRILPSSIHTLVPAMCPIETIISETYSHCQPGPEIRGQKSKTWDSCLTRFVCPVLVSAAVLGSTYSAASTLDGMILIFYSDSMQLKSTLSNGESLLDELALFGNERYLASIDVKYLKFWDLDEGAIIRTIDTGIFRPVALQSKDDESVVVAVTENGEVVTWETQNGTEVDRWRLGDNKIARKAAISQNGAFLAVVYYDTPTLLLFSMKKRMLIGRCNFPNNDSDFLRIPGMAFSTRPDVNVVLVLYEFRGIALYALESAEFLCYVESPDPRVMECSPDGSKLFVRDDGGRISIYELGAARASGVSLLYRFKGSPSGFLGVVFSPDCSRFAVLSRNQFEVWELPVLAYNELEAGNHTDQGQETAILADGSSRVRINAVCSHPSGEFVFCGKEDGSVTCFDTKSAIETVILDGDNFGYSVVTCIAFIERKELLVVAELSMGIKIYNVAVSYTGCKLGSIFSQIEVRDSPRWILANSSGTRLLFGKNGWAELWTIEGEKVNDSIGSVNAAIVTNHPLLEDVFVFVESDGQMRFYSWLDGLEKKQPPSLDEPISFLEHCVLVERYGLTPHLLKSAFSPPALTEDSPNYSNPGPYLQFRPNPSFMKHINKIRRLICITGKLVLFIDKDLWVCSLDLDQEYPARSQNGGAQRHFFLLPEWWPRFAKIAIEYIPAKQTSFLQRSLSITELGSSRWARRYRVDIQGKEEESYFLKISLGEHGREAIKGEFEATSHIHRVPGRFTPKPLAWGSFSTLQNTHYYICAFYKLQEVDLLDRAEFCKSLATLHKQSVSPNGKFGYHVVTYNGDLPQDNGYTDSWEGFFTRGFLHMLELNVERGGRWREMEELKERMISVVIPRLLGPMEAGGRRVVPSLVHGDLWCGNVAVDCATGRSLVFDPAGFYAHNECTCMSL
ncbi:hypothetical protein FQN49_005206 [Arthroderma sp. PD_2]|nr:hypothetical protein FQN49_005206 [Arthroderma sp. PD_2]